MSITTAIAIYFLIWWIVLFAVLPFGVRSQHEAEEGRPLGSDPGAPILPRLGRKLLWTTLWSAVLFGAAAFLYVKGMVSLEDLGTLFGLFRPT